MGRKIWAIVAFNVYSLFLISAFQENTAYLFDVSLINEMRLKGADINPRDWGWGGHYIWRLFAAVVVTALAGILTGAIAKSNGKKISAAANIPSILIWLGMIYLFGFANVEVEGKIGFIVISILAIPLTSYIAYTFGGIGEELQRETFPEDTVLGIRSYHWVWAAFPIYWYALGIVFVTAKFIGFQLATWADTSIFAAIISLLMLVPIIAWLYPLRIVHRVLTGELLSSNHAAIRGFANFGVLVFGMLLATGVQFVIYWVLSKVLK